MPASRYRPTSPPQARAGADVASSPRSPLSEAVPPPVSPPSSVRGVASAPDGGTTTAVDDAEATPRLLAQVAELQAQLEASQAQAEAERRTAASARALFKSSTAAHATASRTARTSSASQIDELQTELSEVDASRQRLADENAAVSLASKRFLDQRSKDALEAREQAHAAATGRASQASQAQARALEKRHEQALSQMVAQNSSVLAAAAAAAASQAVQSREKFQAELSAVSSENAAAIAKLEAENELLRRTHMHEMRMMEVSHDLALQRTTSSLSAAMDSAAQTFASQLTDRDTARNDLVVEHLEASAAVEAGSKREEQLLAELARAAAANVTAVAALEIELEALGQDHAATLAAAEVQSEATVEEEMEAYAEELVEAESKLEETVSELNAQHAAAIDAATHAAGAQAVETRAKMDADVAAAAAEKLAAVAVLEAEVTDLRHNNAEAVEQIEKDQKLKLQRAMYAHSVAMETVAKASAEAYSALESTLAVTRAELSEQETATAEAEAVKAKAEAQVVQLVQAMGAENGLLKAEIVSMKQDLARAVSTAKESFELASGYTEVMAGLDEQHSYDIADVDRAAKTQVAESLQSAIDSLSHGHAQDMLAVETRYRKELQELRAQLSKSASAPLAARKSSAAATAVVQENEEVHDDSDDPVAFLRTRVDTLVESGASKLLSKARSHTEPEPEPEPEPEQTEQLEYGVNATDIAAANMARIVAEEVQPDATDEAFAEMVAEIVEHRRIVAEAAANKVCAVVALETALELAETAASADLLKYISGLEWLMAKAARANVLQVEVEELRRDLSTATAVSQVAGMDAADTAVAPSGILLQLDDEEAAEAQAAEEEEAHAQSWSVRMEAKVGEQALAKDAIAIRFIVKIQARIRGRQARRRAAEKRLAALREQEAADPPSGGGSRLEMDVAEWLGAQGESRLAAVVKFDFGAAGGGDEVRLRRGDAVRPDRGGAGQGGLGDLRPGRPGPVRRAVGCALPGGCGGGPPAVVRRGS